MKMMFLEGFLWAFLLVPLAPLRKFLASSAHVAGPLRACL